VGRRLWWGAVAGTTAGLAMLAYALGLAGLGRSECLQPYLALSVSMPSPTTNRPCSLPEHVRHL
jgi:hypothetical protein